MKRSHSKLSSGVFPALLVASALATGAQAQSTLTWTGDAGGNWQDAANWSGAGAPAGTAADDIASFDSGSANTAVTISQDTTIGRLQFLSGAASYTISGSTLEIVRSTGAFIDHSAGNHQQIDALVRLNASGTGANGRLINVATGSSLTLTEGLSLARSGTATDTNVDIRGGGTVTLGKAISGLNTMIANGTGTTVNYRGGGNRLLVDTGGRINLNAATSASLDLRGNGSSVYVQFAGSAGNANSMEVRSSAGNTVTFGADVAGGGTATYNRTVSLHRNGTVDNATMQFDAKANNILVLSGVIQDYSGNAAGNGTRVEITGEGAVRLAGTAANTTLTPIDIAEGATLELAKSDGITAVAGGSVTVRQGGTLRLLASNQIADGVSLLLDGGSFDAGSYTDTLGGLSVSAAGGSIDFSGTQGIITFSSLASLEGLLTINGWNENFSIVFLDGSGWNETTLSQVNFAGFGGAQFDADTGRLYAVVPEPGTAAAFVAVAAAAVIYLKRRRR